MFTEINVSSLWDQSHFIEKECRLPFNGDVLVNPENIPTFVNHFVSMFVGKKEVKYECSLQTT